MARAYVPAPFKKYGEALALTQRAHFHIREASTLLSLMGDGQQVVGTEFYPLTQKHLDDLEKSFTEDELRYKTDWFAYNGGVLESEGKKVEKPLFFDIALNYVDLDIEKLRERAGKVSSKSPAQAPAASVTKSKQEVEKVVEEAQEKQATSTLGSLLGGWWGRK